MILCELKKELPQSWADMESYIDKNPKNSAIQIQMAAARVMPSFNELWCTSMVIMIIVPIKSMKHKLLVEENLGLVQ